VLLTGASVRAQSGVLPARLSDADFWKIVTTFSEAGGTFTTDNFTSNEAAVGQVATRLRTDGHTGGAFIGVGPEQNFTYIAAIEPRIAFIVDIRRQAAIQQLMFKALFELSATRAEFIERLFSLAAPSGAPLPPDAPIHDIWPHYLNATPDSGLSSRNLAAIRRHLTDTHNFVLSASDIASLEHVYRSFVQTGPLINYLTGMRAPSPILRSANFASLTMTVDSAGKAMSFLANDRNFALVRDMHTRNLIIPIVGDFGGTQALRAVGDYLRASGTTVSAFYVSNVEQYLFRPVDQVRIFYENVAALPLDSTSVLVRPGSAGSAGLSSAPFTPQSSDSAVRVFAQQLRAPAVLLTPPAALCGALKFLGAFRAGRVTVYEDAVTCVH
jgi:hypothetical protein